MISFCCQIQVMIYNLSFNDHYYYGNNFLKISDTFSYLGIVLSHTGKFYISQDTLASNGLRAIYGLYKSLKSMYNPNVNLQCRLFNKLIQPVCEYACEVWGFHKAPSIERLHLHYCKRVLKVKKSTANFFVYGELGRYRMYVNRYLKMKYWAK